MNQFKVSHSSGRDINIVLAQPPLIQIATNPPPTTTDLDSFLLHYTLTNLTT